MGTFDYYTAEEANIVSQNNLALCRADYFETCWCKSNSSQPIICHYLLHHAVSFSNSSYFCVYHALRQAVECFNSTYILPKSTVSNIYLYLTITIFVIGLIGNGISIIILLCTKLRRLNIYRNLTILCGLNILYLLSGVIRYRNNYQQDLRNVSMELCRLHRFIVTFIGHLCSWQLVSTSIQRVHALLSLESHRTTSWKQTLRILFICIVLPLLIFDGQILFNYGFFKKNHVCNDGLSTDIKQFRRALQNPINIHEFSNHIPVVYHIGWTPSPPRKINKENICVVWNILDMLIYVIIPFIIILICSLIIIIKVCQRRRSTITLGGLCHINRDFITTRDHLSTLLITINILFLILTGPLNISLIVQSIFQCLSGKSLSRRKLFLCLNEYLHLLQDSYHALSFIFYCVIGNKFRNSARSICRTIYGKLLEFGMIDRCAETSFVACCLDRRRSSSSGQTTSTNIRLSDARRLTIEPIMNILTPLNTTKRNTYVTFDVNEGTVIHVNTQV